MPATLEQLIAVRSQLAEGLRSYYETLINLLDRTPWYRQGKLIQASSVAIPIRKEAKPPRKDEDDRYRNLLGPEIAASYEKAGLLERREEVSLKDELHRVKRAVFIGAPGGGKSFLTKTIALELAGCPGATAGATHSPGQPATPHLHRTARPGQVDAVCRSGGRADEATPAELSPLGAGEGVGSREAAHRPVLAHPGRLG